MRLLDRNGRKQKSSPATLSLSQLHSLVSSSDKKVAERIRKLAATPRKERQEVIEEYATTLTMVGDASKGKAVFQKNCRNCHSIDPADKQLGPDLRSLTSRSPQSLLTAILDPSQTIDPRYVVYAMVLEDGSVRSGLIKGEDASSITLSVQSGHRQVILRKSIEQMARARVSFMPDGFEMAIKPKQMADLIAYIREL